jgi:hypothetical protein
VLPTDGTGTVYRTAFLHFQLQNCGANIPLSGSTSIIVQDSFDLRPATAGSSISVTVVGTDGESYPLLRVLKDGRRIGVLIENKVSAPEQSVSVSLRESERVFPQVPRSLRLFLFRFLPACPGSPPGGVGAFLFA